MALMLGWSVAGNWMTPMASSSAGRATAALAVSTRIARRCPQNRHIAAPNIARARRPSIARRERPGTGNKPAVTPVVEGRDRMSSAYSHHQRRIFAMKHPLSSVALAALLTAGLPALAQTSSSDKQPPAAQSGTSATGAGTSMPAGTDNAQSGATTGATSNAPTAPAKKAPAAAAADAQSGTAATGAKTSVPAGTDSA